MAVDTTDKALNLASRLCDGATELMGAVRKLSALIDEYGGSGVTFVTEGTPMEFPGTALKHINGQDVTNVITSATAVQQWLSSNFHDDNFDKVRA